MDALVIDAMVCVTVQVTSNSIYCSYKYEYCKLHKDIVGFNIINTQAVHYTQRLRHSIYTFDDDQGISCPLVCWKS